MVSKTQFAITGEDTRYFLNGALLVLKSDGMSLVATDGHRLALVSVPRVSDQAAQPAKGETAEEVRIILPKKTLQELGRLLAESQEPVTLTRSENHLFFEAGGRMLISRVIDGQFPAYDRVIPRTNDKRIEFDRDRLASAVRRVAILSNERSRAVRFQMSPGQVEVTSSSQEFGDAREVLMVDYDGPALQICFNAGYVLDFLGVVETEKVAARVQGRGEPGPDASDWRRGVRLPLRHHADAALAPRRARKAPPRVLRVSCADAGARTRRVAPDEVSSNTVQFHGTTATEH